MTRAQLLSNPRLYVVAWLERKGISVTPVGKLEDKEFKRQKHQLFTTMWLDYCEDLRAWRAEVEEANRRLARGTPPANMPSGTTEKNLAHAFEETITMQIALERNRMIDGIAYDKQLAASGQAQLADWVTAVTGLPAEPHQIAVMQHWIWQVKRKMAGRHVVNHMMPVLVSSEQGGGKSTAARKLAEPIAAYVLAADATLIEDDRRYLALSRYYVGLFDEMAGVEFASIEKLKHIITADQVAFRPMRTNDVEMIDQNCTFIGTANKSVALLINDTGMRRFFEFTAQSPLDWESINRIDYKVIWQSVNTSLETGYYGEHQQEIKKAQEDLQTEDPVKVFLREKGLVILNGASANVKIVTGKALYDLYRDWSEDNGYKLMQSGTLGKRLKLLGVTNRPDKNGARYVFDVSSTCDKGKEEEYGRVIKMG